MSAQLDIFENTELFEELKKTKELSEKTHNTSENVRKGVFARVSAFEKAMLEKFLSQEIRITHLEEMMKGK